MIGLQEINQRLEKEEYKDIGRQIKEMLDHGYYDHEESNIFGKGFIQREQRITPLKAADAQEIMESVRHIPLREFLASSTTTAVGSSFLIPTKIHQVMYDSAVQEDFTDWLSIAIIPGEQIPGTKHNVDIAIDGSYVPKKYMSGGQLPTETIATTQATLDFTEGFGINFRITNDLIEDSQFDLIEMHLRNAGREMGEFATNEALTVLKTATDGDGAVNGGASGTGDTTNFTGGTNDLSTLYRDIHNDGYHPNKIVLTPEAWNHSVVSTIFVAAGTYSEPWAYNVIINGMATKMLGCDVRYGTHATLHLAADAAGTFTKCVTIMFDDRFALLTGRKRWLRIENYSDPVRDLVGATVTTRQDSVTIYDDSIGVITET